MCGASWPPAVGTEAHPAKERPGHHEPRGLQLRAARTHYSLDLGELLLVNDRLNPHSDDLVFRLLLSLPLARDVEAMAADLGLPRQDLVDRPNTPAAPGLRPDTASVQIIGDLPAGQSKHAGRARHAPATPRRGSLWRSCGTSLHEFSFRAQQLVEERTEMDLEKVQLGLSDRHMMGPVIGDIEAVARAARSIQSLPPLRNPTAARSSQTTRSISPGSTRSTRCAKAHESENLDDLPYPIHSHVNMRLCGKSPYIRECASKSKIRRENARDRLVFDGRAFPGRLCQFLHDAARPRRRSLRSAQPRHDQRSRQRSPLVGFETSRFLANLHRNPSRRCHSRPRFHVLDFIRRYGCPDGLLQPGRPAHTGNWYRWATFLALFMHAWSEPDNNGVSRVHSDAATEAAADLLMHNRHQFDVRLDLDLSLRLAAYPSRLGDFMIASAAFMFARKTDARPPSPNKSKARAFTSDEIARILNAVRTAKENGKETDLDLVVMVLLSSGLRRSELLGLALDAVDFEAGTITVRRSVVYDLDRKPLLRDNIVKSDDSYRTVTLDTAVMDRLRARKAWIAEQKLAWGKSLFRRPAARLSRTRRLPLRSACHDVAPAAGLAASQGEGAAGARSSAFDGHTSDRARL
jgi:integrase